MSQRHDEDFDWENSVGVRPFSLRPRNPRWAVWVGYLASQCFGLCSLAIVTLIFTQFNWNRLSDIGSWTAGILGFSQFFLIPFGMGVVASYFWLNTTEGGSATKVAVERSQPAAPQNGMEANVEGETLTERPELPIVKTPSLKQQPRFWGGSALLNTLLSCAGAVLVLREGSLCLIMASPLLWLFIWLGVSAGGRFWVKNPFLSVSLRPLFLLVVFAEAGRTPSPTLVVSTSFHSSASPQTLWRYTANYPRNPHPPRWWLYRLGLPAPMQSTGQLMVGGRRDCLLSGGVDIGEKIVVAQANRKLEFVIDRQPQHPEITHHFILERGRIELVPDGQGGTWLKGTSWYRLNVAPVAYFDLWAQAVVRHTHERVFEWMNELARQHPTTGKLK